MEWLRQRWISVLQRLLAVMKQVAQKRGRRANLPDHLLTGIDGETEAYFYLRRKGYCVVERRWSPGNRPGDLDLIAWHGSQLCFIEVKTRTAHDMAPAEASVDGDKRRVLRMLAHQYVRQLPQQSLPPVRFDILSVYMIPGQEKEFMHFEGAFGWSEHSSGRT
jgi:putative endonuclease